MNTARIIVVYVCVGVSVFIVLVGLRRKGDIVNGLLGLRKKEYIGRKKRKNIYKKKEKRG